MWQEVKAVMEKLGRNDHCWCGSGKKYKNCHMAMDEKIHHYELEGHMVPTHDMLKTREQIEGIKESSVPSAHTCKCICIRVCTRVCLSCPTEKDRRATHISWLVSLQGHHGVQPQGHQWV